MDVPLHKDSRIRKNQNDIRQDHQIMAVNKISI